jgi:hypothetical protein
MVTRNLESTSRYTQARRNLPGLIFARLINDAIEARKFGDATARVARERIIWRHKREEQDQREPVVKGDKLPKASAAKNSARVLPFIG